MIFIRINNIILDPEKILWVQCDQKKSFKVLVRFTDGHDVHFTGKEAIDVWEIFDKKALNNSEE